MAVWPRSSARSAYVMAWRTITRLLKEGELAERQNTLGGGSLVLTARGVARLKDLDIQAQEGFELKYNGPQFFHRTLGTCYLLERARDGAEVFGEYSILRSWAPVKRDFAKERFGKIPDGLILHDGKKLGMRDGLSIADWVEVESAFKPYEDAAKALSLFTKSAALNKSGSITLNKLIFVVDSRQRHHKQLLRYVKKFLSETPNVSADAVLDEVLIAICDIDPPFIWKGVDEYSVRDLLTDAAQKNQSLDDAPDADDN